MAHRAELIENYGSAYTCFATDDGPPHGERGTSGITRGPLARPAAPATRIDSRVGVVINRGVSAVPDAPVQTIEGHNYESALALSKILVAVALEAAQNRIKTKAVKVDAHEAGELEKQLGQIASALSIAQSRLEAPGGLQNRQNRLSIIRGVFEYLVAYPALRKKYAALINPLARFLNIGHGDYVKNQVASVRSPNPTGARLAQNLARTPLEQFTDKSWSEICALCGFTPRLYQESWFEALLLRATNGGDRGILGAPYQVGKTFACFPLAVALSQARFPKKTILIIAPQLKVLDTVIADLERAAPGLRIGRIDADHKDFGQGFDVVVASAWTLGRIENLAGFNATQYGVIATDEAVFLFTQTGGRILNRLGFLDDAGAIRHQADKFLFGFSADVRMRSFARVFGENARLDDKDLPWYVQNKYLHEPVGVRMRYQNLDDATQWEVVNAGGETLSVPTVNLKYISQIYQDCKRRFGDKKFVIFTPNTAHAEAIAAYFNAMEGDGVAYADHSYKETEDNREAEEGFNKGSGPRVLVGVDSLSVGARLVGAVGIVMVYTTSSPRKFGQRLGRILGIHNGEPQRPVTVVEWCGKKIAGRGKQKAWLPQLLGIEDYPGDNVVHRPLQIMSETKTRLPLPKFIVRPDLSGFNLDFVEPETGEKILFSPNRFPAELQYALDTQFDGDAVAMANALRLSEEDLHHYRSGQLPKAYSEVWRMANSLRGDNPAAFVDAWVNDYLDLMQVTYAQDKWREDSAVAQLVSVVRRVSLSADYDVEQGASFACGLELDATEASQLGFVIRGELLDTKGMFTNLDWQTLVKRVILAAREMNEELLNEVLKNAALEVQAEADRRQKREHDRQRRRDAGLPEAEEANHGQGDEFSLDAEEQAFYAVADTLELEEESDEENDLSADTATTTAELEKKTLSEWHDWLSSRIIDLRNRKSLSNEAYVCLHNAGIDTVKDLMELSWAELFIITRAGYDPSLLREIEDMWSGELFNLMWHVESEFDRADLDAAGIARLHALLNQTYSQSGFQFYGEIIQMSEWAWLREANLTPEKFIAAKIDLARQGLYFGMNLHGWQPPVVEVGGATPEDEAIRAVLCKRVDELNISVRTANCLQNAGIEFIWQLVRLTEADVLKTKNSGRKTLNDIKEQLTKLGLTLGMSVNFRALIRETSSVTEQELELASPAAVQALWAKLDVPIQMLDLSVRTANCLQNAGIEYIGQLLRYSDSQSLLKLKNMGRKSLNEIIEFLSRLGLCLGEPTLSWKPPTDRLAEADEIYWSSMDREAAKAGRTLWQGLDRKIDLVDPEMTAVLARKGFLFAGQLAQQTISANFIDSLVADLPVTPANIQYRVSEAIGKYFEGITNLGNFVDRRNNFTMSWKPPTERLVEADLKAIAGRVK